LTRRGIRKTKGCAEQLTPKVEVVGREKTRRHEYKPHKKSGESLEGSLWFRVEALS
jgi:hypothetical protein